MKEKLDELRPEWLKDLTRDQLERLLTLHAWGLLSVDGLYFLEIEKAHGTDEATRIDTDVWDIYGKLEAPRLRAALEIKGNGLEDVAKALKASSWLFYIPDFDFDISDDRKKMVLTVRDCRIQCKRNKKGLGEFPCKSVGVAYLENFVKEFNESMRVQCRFCPPDEHPKDQWCVWEFELSE